jgi:thioredoxin-related protein
MKKHLLVLLTLCFGIGAASSAQTTMPTTESVMTKAYEQAAKENKKVLVIFHASWCGWCKKMEASINDPELKKMFEDNYVLAYLDVMEQPNKKDLENPGALELMTKYKGENQDFPSGLSLMPKVINWLIVRSVLRVLHWILMAKM